MLNIDCKLYNKVIVDRLNNIAVFYISNQFTVEEQSLNIIFDILYFKKYDEKHLTIKIVDLNKFPYILFDTTKEIIHYFSDLPKEEYLKLWIQKTKENLI